MMIQCPGAITTLGKFRAGRGDKAIEKAFIARHAGSSKLVGAWAVLRPYSLLCTMFQPLEFSIKPSLF